jgi:hypothetical protein
MNNAHRPIRFHRLAAGHRVVIRAGFDIAIAFATGATRREGRNKHEAPQLSWRTAILSPSPRAWPFNVGRSRYADRLRPNFFWSRAIEATRPNRRGKSDVLRRCELLADPTELAKLC